MDNLRHISGEARSVGFYVFSCFCVRMAQKGFLIAVEGTDSSGKATQAKLLVERLQRRGFVVELVSLPRYHEFFGSLVGKYLAGEFGSKEELPPEFASLLYALDRYHAKKGWNQKLEMGISLVFDRYRASNLAHHAAKFETKKEQEGFVKWLKTVESRLPKENATVFLNMPEEAAQQLMRGKDREKNYRQGQEKDQHERDVPYLRRTRELYKKLAKKEKWAVVEAAFLDGKEWVVRSKEEVSEEVWNKLCKKIPAFKK